MCSFLISNLSINLLSAGSFQWQKLATPRGNPGLLVIRFSYSTPNCFLLKPSDLFYPMKPQRINKIPLCHGRRSNMFKQCAASSESSLLWAKESQFFENDPQTMRPSSSRPHLCLKISQRHAGNSHKGIKSSGYGLLRTEEAGTRISYPLFLKNEIIAFCLIWGWKQTSVTGF